MFPCVFYDNRLDDALPVASTTASGDVRNLRDWRKYTNWTPSAMPATVTTPNLGSPKAADYALFHTHNLGSKGATVEIRGSTDNFAASDVLVATSTPTTDDPLLLLFNSASFAYWRMKFTGALAPTVAIGVIGAKLLFPVGLAQGFDPLARDVNGQANSNENGEPLGKAIYFESWTQDLLFEKVAWSFVRNTFLPAWRAKLRGSPFGFAWDPVLYPTEVLIASGGMSLKTPHSSGSLADLQLTLSGVIT